jgi:hypothetical protein
MVDSPDHYGNNWEVGNFIRSQKLNFHLGNAIKYICRADYKGHRTQDLQKAIHYLENELDYSALQDDEPVRPSHSIPFSLWDDELGGTPDYATDFDC